jgi:hypothetical protein
MQSARQFVQTVTLGARHDDPAAIQASTGKSVLWAGATACQSMMSGERTRPGPTSATDERSGAGSQASHAAERRASACADQASGHCTSTRRSSTGGETQRDGDDSGKSKHF